jgi:hypothetical protein
VNINSWQTDGKTMVQGVFESNAHEAYYATGDGWTVSVGDDETLQMQFTNDAGGLFRKSLNGETPMPGDVDGEKAVSEIVVKSIGGSVVHVTV